MIDSLKIVKDFWDYANIASSIVCGILSVVLIFVCSAFLSDRRKKRQKEEDALNYLSICTNRYLQHVIEYLQIEKHREVCLKAYLDDSKNRLKLFQAYQIIKVPIPNFEMSLPDYAFTLKLRPVLLNTLLLYQELYAEIMSSVNMFNREADMILRPDVPEEIIINAANDALKENFEESNLFRWKFTLCRTIFELQRLLNEIHECQILIKCKKPIFIEVYGEVLTTVKEAEAFVDKYSPNPSWRESIVVPNNFNEKSSWFDKFKQKRKEKQDKIDAILKAHSMEISMMHSNLTVLSQINGTMQKFQSLIDQLIKNIPKAEQINKDNQDKKDV